MFVCVYPSIAKPSVKHNFTDGFRKPGVYIYSIFIFKIHTLKKNIKFKHFSYCNSSYKKILKNKNMVRIDSIILEFSHIFQLLDFYLSRPVKRSLQ